jgi:hypothetical protein
LRALTWCRPRLKSGKSRSSASGTPVIAIQARVVESDPYLASDYVNGTLSWNDGTLPIVYDTTSGTLAVNVARACLRANT